MCDGICQNQTISVLYKNTNCLITRADFSDDWVDALNVNTPRSPCLSCDRVNHDKNCVACQVCSLRILYVESIDPEALLWGRYSYSGGQPQHVNREKHTFEESLKIKHAIEEYADRYCYRNNLNLKHIINTSSKKKRIVKSRRELIVNIKLRMEVQNKHIASALKMTPATISLALIKSRKGVVVWSRPAKTGIKIYSNDRTLLKKSPGFQVRRGFCLVLNFMVYRLFLLFRSSRLALFDQF